MSGYVDNFIKQHKEYFKRNKTVIENNDWNKKEKYVEKEIDSLFSEIAELQKTNFSEERDKEIKELQNEIFRVKERAKKNKKALFNEENELTKSILGRLSAFIKETEKTGDRKLEKVQKFIDNTVKIVNVHIKKCDTYLNYSLDNLIDDTEDEDEIHFRSEEIRFQDEAFNAKITIQDTLSKLNITNSIENLSIEFFKNEKASIPMMDVLPLLSEDIKELTENLKLPTEIGDITFHIHRKKGEYPEWDRKKHYWEQTQEALDYWYNEWLKIKNGFWVDGYFFHPWLYYHLNFFQTPMPSEEGGEKISQPDLRDNEWFITEQLKAIAVEEGGYYTKEGLCFFGSRRVAKALRNDQILYYEDGEKPIGEAKVGDKIYGSDGKLTTIKGVYPQGVVELYEVEFADGRKSICCDEHLWTVFDYQSKKWKTLPLKEILKDNYFFERVRKDTLKTSIVYKYYIPITNALEYEKKDLILDPYYLGTWLGDGDTYAQNITTEDEETKIWLEKYSKRNNLIYKEDKTEGTETVRIRLCKTKGKTNPLMDKLRELNLIGNKHIPKEYYRSSVEQRMELLRGLLDTDGTIYKKGNGISFTSENKSLAEDVRKLALSLGIHVTIKDYTGSYIKKNGELNTYTKVTFFTSKDIFKLSRKLKRIDKNPVASRENKKHRVAIVDIKSIKSDYATCIRVDNESKEFLTNDYVVTHNSTNMASICEWRALTVENISTAITSGSEGDLEELTHKIKTSMRVKTPAFNLPIQKQSWLGGTVELGLKRDQSTFLEHSRHTIKNMASGSKAASQKAAGGAPSIYLIEEIAKFAFEKGYLAALPAFQSNYGLKTIIIAVGTSGEHSLSGDALKAVSNPKTLKFREMDWDLFESKIPPEFITWKRRTFATFIPGQMGYKTGFKRIQQGFGDFLGIKSDYLNKIIIHKTDWENNTRIILEDRKLVENDPIKLQQETIQYPIDPEECFISKEKNIFPFKEARRKRQLLEKEGGWDRRRNLYRGFDGKIVAEISTEALAKYPHNGDTIDAPFLIFEDIPQIKPPKYVYVAGGDFYKQESSDTDSVGTIYIWKYDLFADPFSRKLVASYSARPSTFSKFYENCLLLLEAYNAVIFPENEDLGGFQTFLERKRMADYYIMPHIDFNSTLQHSENGKRKYGWTAKQSKKKLLNLFADYLNRPMVIQNEQGEEVEIKTVESIDDIYLLEELEKFNPEDNFDRITACIGAVGYLHFLEKNYIYPKGYKGNISQQQEKPKKRKQRKRGFYTPPNKRAGFYRKRK